MRFNGKRRFGARPEDLTELWTRVREGFSVGQTRLSPGVIADRAARASFGPTPETAVIVSKAVFSASVAKP